MIIQSILGARGLAIAADVGFVCACLAFVWGAIKLAYQRTQGQAMPRNRFTKTFDVLVEAFNIVWGTVNRVVKLDTGKSLFLPTLPADGSPPSRSAATIDALSTENASLRASLADYHCRVADSHAMTEPGFDPLARQTITPEVLAEIAGRGQRGSVEAGAAGFIALLVGILAMGLYAASCVPVRRLVLDHTGGVPSRGPCVPTAQRCALLDGGVYLPVVCSADHREWPTHPLSPDGEQLACAAGEGCEVTDAGIARCTAADGGAR